MTVVHLPVAAQTAGAACSSPPARWPAPVSGMHVSHLMSLSVARYFRWQGSAPVHNPRAAWRAAQQTRQSNHVRSSSERHLARGYESICRPARKLSHPPRPESSTNDASTAANARPRPRCGYRQQAWVLEEAPSASSNMRCRIGRYRRPNWGRAGPMSKLPASRRDAMPTWRLDPIGARATT